MDILIGDRICVMAVFTTLENKWEVTITIQMIMTKKWIVDNGTNENLSETISATVNLIKENKIANAEKNILLVALGKSISLDIYNDSVDMANAFFNLEETKKSTCDFHITSPWWFLSS